MRVSGSTCNHSREEIAQQAQEQGYILRDELGEVHISQGLHEQEILILIQIVSLCLPGRPAAHVDSSYLVVALAAKGNGRV